MVTNGHRITEEILSKKCHFLCGVSDRKGGTKFSYFNIFNLIFLKFESSHLVLDNGSTCCNPISLDYCFQIFKTEKQKCHDWELHISQK